MQVPPGRGRKGPVRLATFNIKHAELRGLAPLAEVLREARTDIAGLQEVDVGCLRSGCADQPPSWERLWAWPPASRPRCRSRAAPTETPSSPCRSCCRAS